MALRRWRPPLRIPRTAAAHTMLSRNGCKRSPRAFHPVGRISRRQRPHDGENARQRHTKFPSQTLVHLRVCSSLTRSPSRERTVLTLPKHALSFFQYMRASVCSDTHQNTCVAFAINSGSLRLQPPSLCPCAVHRGVQVSDATMALADNTAIVQGEPRSFRKPAQPRQQYALQLHQSPWHWLFGAPPAPLRHGMAHLPAPTDSL